MADEQTTYIRNCPSVWVIHMGANRGAKHRLIHCLSFTLSIIRGISQHYVLAELHLVGAFHLSSTLCPVSSDFLFCPCAYRIPVPSSHSSRVVQSLCKHENGHHEISHLFVMIEEVTRSVHTLFLFGGRGLRWTLRDPCHSLPHLGTSTPATSKVTNPPTDLQEPPVRPLTHVLNSTVNLPLTSVPLFRTAIKWSHQRESHCYFNKTQ